VLTRYNELMRSDRKVVIINPSPKKKGKQNVVHNDKDDVCKDKEKNRKEYDSDYHH